ncbi:hypothetical protein GW17_00006778 [Ensete ventricosum]|nr:hypothetical protein GW17_00006778 [Ensete ventricosum]
MNPNQVERSDLARGHGDGGLASFLEQPCWPQNNSFLGASRQWGFRCCCKYSPNTYSLPAMADMKKPAEAISGNMTTGQC